MVPVVCWRSPSPARAVGEGARAWSRVPAAKPGKAQRPTLSEKSGGCWHHVMQSQTAAANRGKRAKNTPAGSRPEGGGSGAEGLITHTKLTLTGALRFPNPSRGLRGLQRERSGERPGESPLASSATGAPLCCHWPAPCGVARPGAPGPLLT